MGAPWQLLFERNAFECLQTYAHWPGQQKHSARHYTTNNGDFASHVLIWLLLCTRQTPTKITKRTEQGSSSDRRQG
jgi:hypothetical protein